jgi:hypothetical protein
MEILNLTVFLSFSLAVFFLALYLRNQKSESKGSPEQHALLPFQDDETGAPSDPNRQSRTRH